MIEALSTPRNRNRTFVLLAVCGVMAIAAAATGIDDNPPGLLLAFLSACALILAFVHPWRISKKFCSLIYASILGFILFAVLHNLFEFAASKLGGLGLLPVLLSGAGGAFFLAATLLCPSALLVGVVGAVAMYWREHHSQ
ncbi:MAG: hypothetical protein JXB15_04420 [Anaerolineales bacterium]|nr:hypothetical protein [Anaerolineales bacterium]